MLPTPRAVIIALFAAPLIVLGTWLPGAQWLALGYFLLILGLLALDWRLAGNIRSLEITRQHDNRLSLGAENPVTLRLTNRSMRPVTFTMRDEPPESFIVLTARFTSPSGDADEAGIASGEKRQEVISTAAGVSTAAAHYTAVDAPLLHGQAAPRQTWEEVYYLRPLRRGDYRFGDISLRWRGPLGLVTRQGCVPAANPVKVYPNLLDVRRYDLLLRRNRLQEIGLRHSRLFGAGHRVRAPARLPGR